ncbi:LAQU0S03e07734g1_1 [Lachancea quebecensis]|uniref:LAQU0S03e07734g1_1 n=1 Tax=Lachancea quebecensis TaxID=1654605 RepID=A0A0N7ML95_9SACH|nr:LAQU0S03e07734g1_1 [Lachancea quebecensis]
MNDGDSDCSDTTKEPQADVIKDRENASELDSPSEAPGDETEELQVSDGPIKLQPLIQWLPKELSFTAFDAYDNNLYLGTDVGDLLHYFEMEPGNYMLVSQTKFDSSRDLPIERIRILPLIELALVHCAGSLHFFLLPEFAPVPNMNSISEVSDFIVLKYSASSSSYKIQIFGESGARALRISSRNVTTSRTVYHKPITKARVHGKRLLAARGPNYELIDLKDGTETPLFHVSETNTNLKPLIVPYSSSEFLLACGSSEGESAMGLVINAQGDITQGTIVFEKFPLDLMVDLPFVIVDYGMTGVYIYQVELNKEPSLVQKITSEQKRLRFVRSSHIFNLSNSENKTLIVDKLRLVPLKPGNHEFRINQEKEYIQDIVEENTSLVLYCSGGIYLLCKKPLILEVADYSESAIDHVSRILGDIESSPVLSAFSEVEKGFFRTLYLLLETLHCSSIDRSIAKKWCTFSRVIDIRIFLHLCGIETYGDLWAPHGLQKFIAETRLLKLVNKFENDLDVLSFMRKTLKRSQFDDLKDSENVLKSFDVAIVRICVEKNLDVEIDQCEPISFPEITKVVEQKQSLYAPVMLELCSKCGEYSRCLELLRDLNRPRDFSDFLLANYDHLQNQDSYTDQDLLKDIIYLIESCKTTKEYDIIIENIRKTLECGEPKTKDLISMATKSSTKILLLEHLGTGDLNDKRYMVNYYVAELQEVMETENLWDNFAELSATYSKDLDYLKPTFGNFIDISLKQDPKCTRVLEICNKLRSIMYGSDNSFLNIVCDEVKKFDIANILTLYLVKDEDKETVFGENLLDELMTFNDYETIDRIVKEANVVKVLKYYLQLGSQKDSIVLVQKHIQKNLRRLKHREQILAVLESIPLDYSLASIVDAIAPILIKLESTLGQQELHKSLLKERIQSKQKLIRRLGAE